MEGRKNGALITAIVFAALAISGSMLFVGVQMMNASAGDVSVNVMDEQIDKAIERYIEKQQKEAEEAQKKAMEEEEKKSAEMVKNVDKVSNEDHIYGNADAKISLIEYSDFQCPYCKRFHPTPKALVDEYDNVNWIYRHYPLSFHDPAATLQAMASECAAELGGNDAFWDYADGLYEQNPKDNSSLVALAADQGLDEASFKTCLDSEKYKQKVKDQMQNGVDSGVRGTPGTIVLNNETGEAKLLSGAQKADAFKKLIDEM